MQQNQALISVVLPVFNGERFIADAIESVIAQTYSNWELLIVDDGSNDGSALICDKYAASDSRIKVFHQPNGGVNSARARGVQQLSGDYMTFLDADDTFSKDALMQMKSSFSDTIDVVSCGDTNLILGKEDYLMALWSGRLLPGICTKMFRSSIFKQIDYSLERRIVMGEDLLINSMYALIINQARVIDTFVYNINDNNKTSVTKTFKHSWDYEKYFFSKVRELFLHKCIAFDSFAQINLLVNKSWLNAMKYTMLDGGSIDYKDSDFKEVYNYFKANKKELGPSERLIFLVKNPVLYRMIIKSYLNHRRADK